MYLMQELRVLYYFFMEIHHIGSVRLDDCSAYGPQMARIRCGSSTFSRFCGMLLFKSNQFLSIASLSRRKKKTLVYGSHLNCSRSFFKMLLVAIVEDDRCIFPFLGSLCYL